MRAGDEVRVDQEGMVPAIADPVASTEILCFANRLNVGAARKLARINWALIVSGQPYDETKAFAGTAASTARCLKNLQR